MDSEVPCLRFVVCTSVTDELYGSCGALCTTGSGGTVRRWIDGDSILFVFIPPACIADGAYVCNIDGTLG